MGLREQAAEDNRNILEDDATGFGWPIQVTAPNGDTAAMVGLSTDIHMTIDPETGQAVSGRNASVSLSIQGLTDAGFSELPRNIASANSRPWVVAFEDVSGNAHTFKVCEALPDRAMGCIVCKLEAYKLSA